MTELVMKNKSRSGFLSATKKDDRNKRTINAVLGDISKS